MANVQPVWLSQATAIVLGFGFAGGKESESDLNLRVYVYVGRWSYVDSKEAAVNRYYTSSIHPLIA